MGRRRARSSAEAAVCRKTVLSSALECAFGGSCKGPIGSCSSLRDVIPAPPSIRSPEWAHTFIRDRTATADGLFHTALFVLLGGIGLYKAQQRSSKARAAAAAKAAASDKSAEAKTDDQGSVMTSPPTISAKPKSIRSLQLRFLPVFWLLRLAFWMAGPYFYPVYASKIIDGAPASRRLISNIFLAGFSAIVVFAPLTGKAVDQYGRKKGTLAAVFLYALGALSTKTHAVVLLYLGRAAGGIGTNLLSGAPESWLVSEAMETGDDNDGAYLKETFGMAYAYDPLVAILAGQIAGAAAGYAGPTGPFTIMPLFLIAGGLIALLTWKENKGGTSEVGVGNNTKRRPKRGPASTSRSRATPDSPTRKAIDKNRRKSDDGGWGNWDSDSDSDTDSEAEVNDFIFEIGGPSDIRQEPKHATKEKIRRQKIKQFRRESFRRRGSHQSTSSGLDLVRIPSLNNLNIEEMDDTPQIRDGLKIVMTDKKMLMLGAVQSLFEGSMYIFVMQWPPALIVAVKGYYGADETVPFGTIFSCFMTCCMVGSTIFGKLSSRKRASMERLFLGMLVVSAISMGAATWAIYADHNFVALVLSLFAFEGCVGTYFPLIGSMRSKYLYASHRSVIMTLFSVPLNVLVVSVCLFLNKLGTTGAFVVATISLTIATACMAQLIYIRKRDARRHWMEVKKVLRRLSLTRRFVEAVGEKRDEKRKHKSMPVTRKENEEKLRMTMRETVRDSIRMGAIMGA